MLGQDKENPFELFSKWFEEAKASKIEEPTAMALSTCTKDGVPSSRMVLLKGFDENGFVFFTNYGSRKAKELIENPRASLCFFWSDLNKQVRINGTVEKVSEGESDEYFATRDRKSQIGAWASKQSEPLADTKTLLADVAKKAAEFGVGEVPRPEFWGGFRVIPSHIEFWQRGEYRVHKRILYTRDGDGWDIGYLYP